MIYLLGGHEAFGEEIVASMKKEISICRQMVFVPTSPADEEKSITYMLKIVDQFREMGFTDAKGQLIRQNDTQEVIENKFKGSDLIYLMGGDPVTQMDFMKEKGLIDLLQTYDKVIVGFSAGAINLSKSSLITEDHEADLSSYSGLNMASGISVDVHYNNQKRDVINHLQEKYDLNKVYGIPEESGIFINEGEMTFLGDSPISLLMKGLPAMDIKYFTE